MVAAVVYLLTVCCSLKRMFSGGFTLTPVNTLAISFVNKDCFNKASSTHVVINHFLQSLLKNKVSSLVSLRNFSCGLRLRTVIILISSGVYADVSSRSV